MRYDQPITFLFGSLGTVRGRFVAQDSVGSSTSGLYVATRYIVTVPHRVTGLPDLGKIKWRGREYWIHENRVTERWRGDRFVSSTFEVRT